MRTANATCRPGWWPGMVIGFLITAASAIVLVRFEGVREVTEEERPVQRPGPVSGAELVPNGDAQ